MITDAIKDSNGKGVVMDVTNQDSINTSVNQIKEDYGVIYGLVNNAGITNDNLLMRMSDEQWNSVIETNLTSLYRVTKSVVKDMMKARTGRIVNIGSIVGQMGNAGQSNYSATKSGLLGFTKSLARELSSRNINVNAVSPGFIDTDMTKALSDDQIESLTKNIPLGRIASPDEVSSVVAFLLSDDSSYITGENINVNGGLYM
jgi:3-oxoacyl-[acyl-carrier protein] reductase